jgi:hypothetical protein
VRRRARRTRRPRARRRRRIACAAPRIKFRPSLTFPLSKPAPSSSAPRKPRQTSCAPNRPPVRSLLANRRQF